MDINLEDLMRGEWEVLDHDKIFSLRHELADWIEARERGDYDTRLLEGALAVCDSWLDGNK